MGTVLTMGKMEPLYIKGNGKKIKKNQIAKFFEKLIISTKNNVYNYLYFNINNF